MRTMQGTLQSHNNSEEGSKKLAKTEPIQMCLHLLPKGGEDETVRMAGGRLFHARDAVTGKARSPRVDRCTDGTTSVMVVDERRWRQASTLAVQQSSQRDMD